MARKWNLPPPPPLGLPTCFEPGCREPAAYGYGCTLRSFGRHYCDAHRPDVMGAAREGRADDRRTVRDGR